MKLTLAILSTILLVAVRQGAAVGTNHHDKSTPLSDQNPVSTGSSQIYPSPTNIYSILSGHSSILDDTGSDAASQAQNVGYNSGTGVGTNDKSFTNRLSHPYDLGNTGASKLYPSPSHFFSTFSGHVQQNSIPDESASGAASQARNVGQNIGAGVRSNGKSSPSHLEGTGRSKPSGSTGSSYTYPHPKYVPFIFSGDSVEAAARKNKAGAVPGKVSKTTNKKNHIN